MVCWGWIKNLSNFDSQFKNEPSCLLGVSYAYFLSFAIGFEIFGTAFINGFFLSEIVWLTWPEVCLFQAKSKGFLC